MAVIEASAPLRVPRVGPFLADQGDERVARGEMLPDGLRQGAPEWDRPGIDENPARPERLQQISVEGRGFVCRLTAAIADEDTPHGELRPSLAVDLRHPLTLRSLDPTALPVALPGRGAAGD